MSRILLIGAALLVLAGIYFSITLPPSGVWHELPGPDPNLGIRIRVPHGWGCQQIPGDPVQYTFLPPAVARPRFEVMFGRDESVPETIEQVAPLLSADGGLWRHDAQRQLDWQLEDLRNIHVTILLERPQVVTLSVSSGGLPDIDFEETVIEIVDSVESASSPRFTAVDSSGDADTRFAFAYGRVRTMWIITSGIAGVLLGLSIWNMLLERRQQRRQVEKAEKASRVRTKLESAGLTDQPAALTLESARNRGLAERTESGTWSMPGDVESEDLGTRLGKKKRAK